MRPFLKEKKKYLFIFFYILPGNMYFKLNQGKL